MIQATAAESDQLARAATGPGEKAAGGDGSGTPVDDVAPVSAADRSPIASLSSSLDRQLLATGMVLSLVGLCILGFLGYVFVFTGLRENRDQHSLVQLFATPNPGLLTGSSVREGGPVGVLEIPVLGMKLVVVKGTSPSDLASGPGLMDASALPGTNGNTVIAGRRTTGGAPFGKILTLKSGTKITVVTGLGKFEYKTSFVGTATPGQVDPISSSATGRLTLVTANSGLFPTGRSYVVAKLVTAPVSAPFPRRAPDASQRALSGASTAEIPAIEWGLVLFALLTGTVVAYRRMADHIWTVYLLSTPVILAAAMLCFENLYQMLPATL